MAGDGLAVLSQDDFSAGAFTGESRDLIPGNALEDAINALVDDNGLPVRRGGSVMKSNADLLSTVDSSVVGGRFLWDGYLQGGHRTLVIANNNVSVLNADDATPLRLLGFPIEGAPALALSVAPYPTKPAYVNGMVVFPNGLAYGGSRKVTNYSAGTANIAAGSSQVVGTGTSWLANVDPGMLLAVGGYIAPVREVLSDTALELAFPWPNPAGLAGAYTFQALAQVTQPSHAVTVLPLFAGVAGRLLGMYGSRLYVGAVGVADLSTTDDFHDVPGELLGAEPLRDQAVVFTSTGITVISNIALDLTDDYGNPQRRQEEVNRDIILWSWAGVASYANSLVIPAVDGIWMFDNFSQPRLISGGIAALYRSYVDAGYHTGQAAVLNGHYFLPILDGSNVVVDFLVCRLRPTRRGRGETSFAWSRLNGAAANVAALAVRVASAAARQPYLMGTDATTGRILRLPFWDATGADHNGSAFVTELVTREFRLAPGIRTLTKRLKAAYELIDAVGASTLDIAYSVDGGAWTDIGSDAAEATLADDPTSWKLTGRGKGIRFRIRTAGAATKFVLHALQVYGRESGRQ